MLARKGEMEQKKDSAGWPGVIRFEFSFEKLRDAVTYFAGRVDDLDVLKAAKLIYLADRLHLHKYGRPITGDRYVHLEHGPVPALSLDYIRDLVDPKNRAFVPREKLELLRERIAVEEATPYPRLIATGEWEIEYLSESDIEVLDEIIAEYGHLSPWDCRELTHQHSTWLETSEHEEIDFRLFFKDAPEEANAGLEFMLATQEDRDFIAYLNA